MGLYKDDKHNFVKPSAKLNVCGCGRLNLNDGGVTLHFDREEFLSFAATVSQLATHLPHNLNDSGMNLINGQDSTGCH